MSRLGKIPVAVPKEVKVSVDASSVRLEGPKGKLTLPLPAGISVEQKDGNLIVSRRQDTQQSKANHGTVRSHLVGMIEGVTKGHKRELEIQGVGFRAAMQGKKIVFNLGFSHQKEFEVVQPDVKVSLPQPTQVVIEGPDKAVVGEIAAQIRRLKPPEPYKGKGIRYLGEAVRRKQGKAVTK